MARPALEVADILRCHGPAWRNANAGHVSLAALKVMSAIESCRTAALGGHVARCENTACCYTAIAYNSCRNRHCPKCQGAVAREWMEARAAELLPVPYFHVVFTLPSAISDIAYQNKAVIYDLLFKASAETMTTIAADPRHLGAKIAMTSVLHTWGSAMTHHPHVHMIVPGGGIALDGSAWIAKRPNFLLPVMVLSRLFRRLMIERLTAAHADGQLSFYGAHAHLVETNAFAAFLAGNEKSSDRRNGGACARLPGCDACPMQFFDRPEMQRRHGSIGEDTGRCRLRTLRLAPVSVCTADRRPRRIGRAFAACSAKTYPWQPGVCQIRCSAGLSRQMLLRGRSYAWLGH